MVGGAPGRRRVFEVLAVCTANLCRSPIMEAQLRSALDELPGRFVVRSAGTEAHDGLAVHPDAARALAARELVLPAGWHSRRLTDSDVRRADLVVTATRAHRGEVIARVPQAAGSTFTLRQFGRLVAAAGEQRTERHPGDALVAAALAARGLAAPLHPGDDDLPDPIGRPYRAFEQTAATVADAIDPLRALLARR